MHIARREERAFGLEIRGQSEHHRLDFDATASLLAGTAQRDRKRLLPNGLTPL